MDLEWSPKQLFYFMNATLVDGAKDIRQHQRCTSLETSSGLCCCLTQNRPAALQSELDKFKPAASFDDLAVVLPKRKRKVLDLKHLPQSRIQDEVKMDFLLKIIPTSLQQVTSALISAGGYNYGKLR